MKKSRRICHQRTYSKKQIKLGVWDGLEHTAVLKMDNQQGLIVQHMELWAMLCDSLDGRGTCGEWMCVYLQLSPFAVHLKLSHSLLISRTPIQNLKK